MGHKMAASLLAKALEDGKIWRSDDWGTFPNPLSKKGKVKFYNLYCKKQGMKDLNLNDHLVLSKYLTELYPEEFSHLVCNAEGIPIWNIFGCPRTGNDYDVAVRVTDAQLPLYPGQLEKLEQTFKKTYSDDPKFDSSKEIDVCCISNKNGSYQTNCGGPETFNICFHSYGWHNQKHLPIFQESDLVPLDVSDKLNTISKFVMDKAKEIMGTEAYLPLRKEKQSSYNNGEDRYRFTFKLLGMFNMDPVAKNWKPKFWKSFMMKLAQTYLVSKYPDYHLNPYPYDKLMLAAKFSEDFPEWKDQVTNLLMYKYTEHHDGFKEFLIEMFIKLYDEYYPHISEANYRVGLYINPSPLPDDVFQAFVKSPKHMSDDFYDRLVAEYGEVDGVDQLYVEPCVGLDIFAGYDTFKDRVLDVAQRSPEWSRLYRNVYITGRSGGVRPIPDGATHKEKMELLHNLNMGCIGETMIHSIAQDFLKIILGDCDIATVGMIVEKVADEAVQNKPIHRAFCPDGIARMKETGKLIPLEYKTIFTETKPCNNSVWLREYNLARKQLRGAMELINLGADEPLADFGIALFMFIYPNPETEGYLFDVYWNQIDP